MALDNESFQLQKNLLMQLDHDRSRKCHLCRRSFKYQFSLIQHLKEFHKEEMAVSNAQQQAVHRSTVIQKNPNFDQVQIDYPGHDSCGLKINKEPFLTYRDPDHPDTYFL